ncbi:hypothetical protein OG413_40295 [Streptomyces sp. NBC_01433]|nr:hypothetical protein [Streptomyces sp. NBC_01433]MCX4681441.1 hypothetical protein [Streptomyces sp. NBC_01433]
MNIFADALASSAVAQSVTTVGVPDAMTFSKHFRRTALVSWLTR